LPAVLFILSLPFFPLFLVYWLSALAKSSWLKPALDAAEAALPFYVSVVPGGDRSVPLVAVMIWA